MAELFSGQLAGFIFRKHVIILLQIGEGKSRIC